MTDRFLETVKTPAIARAFVLMEIAEEEIRAVESRVGGEARRRAHDAFRVLAPPPGMSSLSDWVYRAHARELVERAAAAQDLRPATKAEVAVALMASSLRAPLAEDYAALYERLFCAMAPFDLCAELDPTPRGSYEGAVDELYRHLKLKLADEERV